MTEYPLPLARITTGPDNNLWFTNRRERRCRYAGDITTGGDPAPPASVTAGTPFGLTVEAEDSSGNLITSFNGTVTVALANNPGWRHLGGTLSAHASDGVATFSGLTLTTAASGYTLYVSGGGLGWGVTSPITVTPAAPSQVAITQQPPSSVTAGSGFGLQAAIEDAYGNVVTSATNTVTVALASKPERHDAGRHADSDGEPGCCDFSGLTLTNAGSGYTLGRLQQRPQRSDLERHHRDPCRGDATGDHAATARQRRGERRLRSRRRRRGHVRQCGHQRQ